MNRPKLKALLPRLALMAMPLAPGAACASSAPPAPPARAPAPAVAPPAEPPAPPPAQVFADAEVVPTFADPDRVTRLRAAFPVIEAAAAEEVAKQKIPGLVVGAIIDGELAWSRGFGARDLATPSAPDADTVYRIGSITKSVTALAVLSLRDEGALGLDDPLTRHVPEAARLVYPTRDAAPITLRQLLTHTSGLVRKAPIDIRKDSTEADLMASLSGLALQDAPGARHSYSNLGFGLLGVAASRAARAPLRDVVNRRVLAPLGMTATVWRAEDVPPARLATAYAPGPTGAPAPTPAWMLGATEGAGGLYSSVRDMARYVAFQLSAYPPRSAPETGPIRRSTVREAHATGFASGLSVRPAASTKKGDRLVDASAETYGSGWITEQTCEFEPLVRHNGGIDGFSSDLRFLPHEGVGVVVLANLADADPGAVSRKALRALAATGALARRAPSTPASLASALNRLIAVMNAWDETAYAAMLSPGRPAYPKEKEELAGYHARHGACRGFHALEILRSTAGRFRVDCEKGPLDMELSIGAAGLIDGFTGTTPDVPLTAEERRAAEALAGLIGRWSDAVYRKLLDRKSRSREDTVAFFDRVRAAHGACAVQSARQRGFTRTVHLTCDRGGDLTLSFTLDEADRAAVKSFGMRPFQSGTCPIR
jgi:CubicO group peptidase (beta-lactamase class C family)